jgi:hypothetical protein
MKIRDAVVWATILDENPLPPGCASDPSTWAEWSQHATLDGRCRLYGAAVPLLAERWADAMEAAMAADDLHSRVADVASPTLVRVIASTGAFGVTPFQYGCMVAMLSASWYHGELLARWHRRQLLDVVAVGLT